MKKIINWWRRDTGHRYINGGKGVISIFLVIVMLPFVCFADLMVESARYHSAVTLLDEAMDSSSLSVLANYDKYLYDRFGILAVDNKAKISENYNRYLRKNTESLKSWSFNEISAKGQYPLTDEDILIKQIAEFSQYSAPAALVNDLGLGELISALEKMTKMTDIFDIVTGAGKTTDAMITSAEAVETLKRTAGTFETDRATYTSKYNAFSGAYSELVAAIEIQNQKKAQVDSIQNQINSSTEVADLNQSIENINSEVEELKKEKEEGKITNEEYEEQVKQKENELEELKRQIEKAQKENKALYRKLKTAKNELDDANRTVDSLKQTLATEKTNYSNAISTVITDLNTYQTDAEKVLSSIESCISSAQDLGTTIGSVAVKNQKKQDDLEQQKKELNKKIESTKDEGKKKEYEEAKKNIESQIQDLKADGDSVKASGTVVKDETSSYAENIKKTMDGYRKETLERYVTQLEDIKSKVNNLQVERVTSKSTLTKNQYYIELNQGFLTVNTIQTLINTIESKMSGGSFWDCINAMSTGMRSLFSTNLIFDSRLTAYITEDTASEIDLILGDFSTLMNLMDASNEGITGWIKILTRIGEIVNALKSLCGHLLQYLSGMMTRAIAVIQDIFSEKCGEKLLIDEYMVKTLSNRTNMTANGSISGSSLLTGYSFTDVKFTKQSINPPPVIGDIAAIVNLFKDIKEGGSDVMFSGAELEYILTGSRSEIINQTAVFFQIYFIRLILDAFPVFQNKEVQLIAEAAGAPSFGIGTVAVYVLYILIEPLMDTLLIVNGKDISLFKSVVYFTPSGSVALVKRITEFGVTTEDEEKIKSSAKKITGGSVIEGVNSDDSKGITWDYGNYLFALMLLTIDNKTCIERFENIVVLESKAYYGKDSFDIGKTYTCIEGKASGKFAPILPLGGMVSNGLFEQSRVRMRGY